MSSGTGCFLNIFKIINMPLWNILSWPALSHINLNTAFSVIYGLIHKEINKDLEDAENIVNIDSVKNLQAAVLRQTVML